MAIDPIEFQGFAERQGFDPIQAPDPNPFLRENLSTIDASLENLKRGNLANMQAKADAYSKQLAQLADFSTTLQGFLGDAAQIYDKKQEAAANTLFYEDLASQENEIATLTEGESILEEGNNISSSAAAAASRNGAPYSVSKRIAELGGLKGHYYRIKATQEIAKNYGEFYDKSRRDDDREITYGDGLKVAVNKADPTEVEEAVIRATLREEYMEKFTGISRGMLAKYAFPMMRQVDESRAKLNSDRIAVADSEQERQELLDQFLKDGNFQTFVDGYSRTVQINRDGKVVSLQYGGAWPKIQNDLIALASSGVSVDLIGLVGNKKNPVTKKKYMDDPVFATKVRSIQAEIKKAETSYYNNTQSHGQMQFLRTLDQVIAEIPPGATESYYVTAYQELDKVAANLGVTPNYSKLEDHQKRYSQNALQVKDAIARYDVLLRSGRLGDHVDKLLLEPPEIRDKYLEIAEKQQELDRDKRGYKMAEERLKALIIRPLKSAPAETGVAAPFMLNHVLTQYTNRTNELLQTEEYNDKPREASLVALGEIEKEIKDGRNDKDSIYFVDQDGYSNLLEKLVGVNPSLAANKRLQKINKLAQDQGKSLLENETSLSAILDKETLVRAAEGWGRPGYRMDPAIDHLAKRLQLNPLNVIHRARETFGMTELPAVAQLAARAENASPDFKKAVRAITNGTISQNLYLRASGTKDFPVRSAFQSVRPAQVLTPVDSANHPFFVSIGVNEGTRTANGGYTKNWSGHTDPGDKNFNRGTVSGGRGNNLTAEQVDSKWMKILSEEQARRDRAVSRFAPRGTDMYNIIMFNILDLRVQAPLTIDDFIKRIPTIIAEGATPEVIGRLRAESFINPRTGRLEASGFGNNMDRLRADQTRRAGNFRITGGS
jgi:hypothetical protein